MVSIQAALDHMQSCIDKYGSKHDDLKEVQDFVMFKLRSLRTFVICSKKLGNDVQMMSFWGRLDAVVRRILDDEYSMGSVQKDVERFFGDFDPLVEEMDKWFIALSDCDLQQSTDLPVEATSQGVDSILSSVVENFENYLMFCDEDCKDIGHLRRPIEALKEYMVFLRNFISFATLVCGDQQKEVQDLYTEIEALAVSAAHLAVCIFTCEDINKMDSITSALQLRIKPFHNPRLCETYSQSLSSLRNPREFHAPTLHESSAVLMNLIDHLLYLLLGMIQLDVASIIPLQSQLETLYDGLRYLGTRLRKLPNMFNGEIRDAAKVAICNVGVIIFSLHEKDFVIDGELQEFLGSIRVIQSEFEDNKLKFPGPIVLDFLDSLLYYVEKVNSFKADSNVLSCVPKIREDLVFLSSLMNILMELRKAQEDLHEGLWNLGVEVTYKLESLVDQLVVGNVLGSFSPSFLSVAADMKIIKTDASKIFEDKEKVKDIKMATRTVMSIQSALDHLQSRMNTFGKNNGESKGKKATVAVYFRLRCLRMFSICSTKLGINLELLSFWARLDCVVCRIMDDKFSCQSACDDAERFFGNIEPFVEEMDKWFIILSDNNLQKSTLAVVVIDDLIDSVVGYLEDFLVSHHGEYFFVQEIEALKKYLVSSRNFIHFATLLYAAQHQEVQDLFSQIEDLAVSAAHLTLYIFSSEDNNGRMKSINSALQLRIKPSHNYQLYEIHSQALARVKYSRDQLYAPILHHPATAMMGAIGYLCNFLNEILKSKPYYSVITIFSQKKLLEYGFRSLKIFCEKLPRMFHGETGNIIRVVICDVGVRIFSLYRKRDFVTEFDLGLQDFVRYFEVVQLEFEENRLLYFSNSTVLDFLDSILNNCGRIWWSVLSSEPTVKPDLAFLRSLMEKLVELRKHQQGLHQALWNLCIKVVYKYEFHVELQLSYCRGHLENTSMSFLSIEADMHIIKTASFKIFHDWTIEEDHGDIQMAFQTIISILCALDHLQSCLDNDDSEYDEPKRSIVFVMNRLRCLRTFVLCSTKWGNNDQLRTLLLSLDGVVCEILIREFGAGSFMSDSNWFVDRMEYFDSKMDKWFVDISYYELQQCSSSPIANIFGDIFDTLSENLEDFVGSPKSEELAVFEGRIDPLRETIAILTNFISFAKLTCADQHQEVRDIFAQIEAFILSAAHLTVYFFSIPRGFAAYRMESILSALELRIRPFQSPQFYAPALQIKDDPLLVMIDSLLSLLWNMLLSDVALAVPTRSQLEILDSGLRSLRALLRKQPNKLDDRFMDMTRLATCHAGIVISSVDQSDIVIDHSFQEFQVILTKVKELVVDSPGTLILGFLDFLLEYLTEMESSKHDSDTLISASKIQEDLVLLKSLMGKLAELRNTQGGLHRDLWNLGAATAYKIELLIDQLVLVDVAKSFSTSVQSVAENMITIRSDSMEVFNARKQEIVVQNITWASIDQVSSHSTPTFNHFVGFKPEQPLIMERLKRGSKKLQVVAIVGMPGLGKTTLATRVYNEVSDHFSVRAWCSISQVFNPRKVLLELLNHIKKKPPNEYGGKTVDDLAGEFRRCLKGRRYLIFLDDVWDIQAYHWLQVALPDDSTESRIILTTRHGNVAALDKVPVFLSQFSPTESFELLRGKVFPDRKDWPQETQELGMQIAEVCKGLPLTIVMVAGLLTTSEQEFWGNLLQSLRAGIISNADQCERTIELSYNHLPDHLKPCFLSFAVFPEDYDISVKRLIWIWIAEGFVRKNGSMSIEEAATDCLNNLIGRSLVMNAKKGSTGGVKACRMHDLLRDFCLKKANEEFYLHRLEGKEELLSFDDPCNMRRLCIFSEPEHFKESRLYFPRLRSLLFFGRKDSSNGHDMSFLFRVFKLLRVLDMERVYLSFKSPSEIRFLMQLRYLAIQVDSDINPSIGNLSNLETLILKLSRGNKVTLPNTFWNLHKLRHLYSIFGYRPHGTRGIELPADNLESTCNLLDLERLSTLLSCNWDSMEKQLKTFTNIRQLKCHLSGNWIRSKTVSFSFLKQLESLSLSFSVDPRDSVNSAHQCDLTLPNTIKKLTLYGCRWPWTKVSGIAGLPDLEVLKLLSSSFVGDIWQVEEDEFPQLRVLKLSYLDIVEWTALDHFPNLEKLILDNCHKLREIPECLESAVTLELIEVINCSECVAVSVKQVEENLKEMGNSALRVDVRPGW